MRRFGTEPVEGSTGRLRGRQDVRLTRDGWNGPHEQSQTRDGWIGTHRATTDPSWNGRDDTHRATTELGWLERHPQSNRQPTGGQNRRDRFYMPLSPHSRSSRPLADSRMSGCGRASRPQAEFDCVNQLFREARVKGSESRRLSPVSSSRDGQGCCRLVPSKTRKRKGHWPSQQARTRSTSAPRAATAKPSSITSASALPRHGWEALLAQQPALVLLGNGSPSAPTDNGALLCERWRP